MKLLHNFFEIFGIVFMKLRTFEQIMCLPSQIESTLLKLSKGVAHLGGHRGEEAKTYSDFGLKVL